MRSPSWIRVTERGVFTLLLLLFVTLLLALSLSYPYRAKMVPLAIGIPTFLFFLYQFLTDWFPSLERLLPGSHGTVSGNPEISLALQESGTPIDLRRREMVLFLWLLGLALAFFLLGILVAVPLFSLGYIYFQSRDGWKLALGYGLSAWLLVYLLLVKLLNAQIFPGLLFDWLGF